MNLISMSAQEILMLSELTKLAEEATKASALINKSFSNSFGPGKTEIPVFNVERFGEYYGNATLNINGTWTFTDNWGGGNTYEVSCTADGIYKCYRAHYLKKNKLFDLIPENERHNADVAQEFRQFISELEGMS